MHVEKLAGQELSDTSGRSHFHCKLDWCTESRIKESHRDGGRNICCLIGRLCAMGFKLWNDALHAGWESVSLYQTTSSTQGGIFAAGERILPHSPMFIVLCLKQGWNRNAGAGCRLLQDWGLTLLSLWMLGQHCSRAKQDLAVQSLSFHP